MIVNSVRRWCDVSWLTVRQLPESRGQMAEVFVVEGRLGGEPVLWEALEKSGSQLFSMIYITQPANTHRYKHTDDYSAKITTHTHAHSHLQLSLRQLHSRWRAAGKMFVDFFGVENAKRVFTHKRPLNCKDKDQHKNTRRFCSAVQINTQTHSRC